MTNPKTPETSAFRDLLSAAGEDIYDAVSKMPEDVMSERNQQALELSIDHIESLAGAAEFCGLDNVAQVSSLLKDLKEAEKGNGCGLSPKDGILLLDWLGAVSGYLDEPNDTELHRRLAAPFPEELQSAVMAIMQPTEGIPEPASSNSYEPSLALPEEDIQLAQDPDILDESPISFPEEEAQSPIEDTSEALDIDLDNFDFEAFAGEDENLDASPDRILDIFRQELQDITPQLEELAAQLAEDDEQVINAAASSYAQIVERLHTASKELGLIGLVMISEFITDNLLQTIQADQPARVKAIAGLGHWPSVVLAHLQEPANDQLCMAVMDFLEQPHWPQPLSYRDERALLEGLTKELELAGEYEVEARAQTTTPEDLTLEIAHDTSPQMLEAFYAESPGLAEELATLIGKIVKGDNVQKNTIAAQRISHTLKGSANLIGVKGIANLAHHMEDIFEYLAKQHLPPPKPLAKTMQEAADTIEVMMESLQDGDAAPDNAQRALQDVLDWANRIDHGEMAEVSDEIPPDTTRLEPAKPNRDPITTVKAQDEVKIEAPAATGVTVEKEEYLRVKRSTVDSIFNLVGETSIAIAQIQEHLKRTRARGDDARRGDTALQARRLELENLVSIRGVASQQRRLRAASVANETFDSLEMDEYNEFYGTTHSYIEAVADNREATRSITNELQTLEGLFLQQLRLNRELQNLVMATRMVPVNTISARLQRAVRQACRSTDKDVDLRIKGEDMLMDGDVLSKLADPLMHMLRNAVDHSIELPEDRADSGKPTTGSILLSFTQEGSNVTVSCADDGRGLDYERILWVAMERGLVGTHEEPSKPTLARLILHSGFSTREKATQISGRGVGMDVVHNSIIGFKGTMEIGDNQPSGTLITLRLPITLLTSHSILVKSGYERFAIPTTTLDQILSPGTGQFGLLGTKATYQLAHEVYPAMSLESLLGTPTQSETVGNEKNTVLLVRVDSDLVAVSVQQVISSHDLVLKSLGDFVQEVPGVSGVSLLGDGAVVPVLDLAAFIRDASRGAPAKQRAVIPQESAKADMPQVLIVDDSLSVRNSLSQLLSDAGYEPLLARDGLDALGVIQKQRPDLVLTDLEMPRMTGLELASHLRANQPTADLPIIMITSRTMQKHRDQADKAGVNMFVTKPFSEDDLVNAVRYLMH